MICKNRTPCFTRIVLIKLSMSLSSLCVVHLINENTRNEWMHPYRKRLHLGYMQHACRSKIETHICRKKSWNSWKSAWRVNFRSQFCVLHKINNSWHILICAEFTTKNELDWIFCQWIGWFIHLCFFIWFMSWRLRPFDQHMTYKFDTNLYCTTNQFAVHFYK